MISFALAHPRLGPKALARELRDLQSGGCTVSHGTVSSILREAGLNTVGARLAAGRGGQDASGGRL